MTSAARLDRPVARRHVWLVFGGVLLIWLLVLFGIYRVIHSHFQAQLPLQNQALALQLPKFMPVAAEVHNTLVSELTHVLDVDVPVNQRVQATFPAQIPTQIALDTQVALRTVIDYRASVRVAAEFELQVPLKPFMLPGSLPVRLPLAFDVPVHLKVPVDTVLPVALRTPVIARIAGPVSLPLQTTLSSRVALATTLHTPVLTRLQAKLLFPTLEPVEVSLARADLRMPVHWIDPLHRQMLNPPTTVEALVRLPRQAAAILYDPERRPPGLRKVQ